MFDILVRVSSIPLLLFFPEIGIPRHPNANDHFQSDVSVHPVAYHNMRVPYTE
jgi:hypothetical protein